MIEMVLAGREREGRRVWGEVSVVGEGRWMVGEMGFWSVSKALGI